MDCLGLKPLNEVSFGEQKAALGFILVFMLGLKLGFKLALRFGFIVGFIEGGGCEGLERER